MSVYFRAGAFIAVLVALVGYMTYKYMTEVTPTPCTAGQFPISCYNISPKLCEIVWSKTEPTCNDFVKKFNLPPGRLTGPIVFQCQVATLDAALVLKRKGTPECTEKFRDLDGWKQRNGFSAEDNH
jgi:hypothetical protein